MIVKMTVSLNDLSNSLLDGLNKSNYIAIRDSYKIVFLIWSSTRVVVSNKFFSEKKNDILKIVILNVFLLPKSFSEYMYSEEGFGR